MSDETEKRPVGRPRTEDSFTVTWIPQYPDDPPKMMCWGVEFRANVPVTLPKTKTIWAPIRRETMLADGTVAAKSPEQKVAIYDLARNNPAFSVNGEPPLERPGIKVRHDADWYRGHAMSWFQHEHTLDAFNAHWDAEATLREDCGVEERDVQQLSALIEYYRGRLAAA
jgi:hypothetical protein